MTRKRLLVRPDAVHDLRQATAFYRAEAGSQVALRFAEAVQATFRLVVEQPGIGSPRYAHALKLPGLRSHLVQRFPYLIFYVTQVDQIEIWRVLHTQRDIPASFGEAEA